MGKKRKKIGIMGGTFDPIHVGHLILGEQAYEQLGLDEVWFMPSGNPPHKKEREGRATDRERVSMVRRAISGNPHFSLSLLEMEKDGYTYTYHTLETLKREQPDTDYYFIIGAASLFNLHTWKNPERICQCCIMVVASRNHASAEKLLEEMKKASQLYQGEFLLLETMNVDVSSQEIRTWIQEGKSIRYYVPDPVIDFIEKKGIYKRWQNTIS